MAKRSENLAQLAVDGHRIHGLPWYLSDKASQLRIRTPAFDKSLLSWAFAKRALSSAATREPAVGGRDGSGGGDGRGGEGGNDGKGIGEDGKGGSGVTKCDGNEAGCRSTIDFGGGGGNGILTAVGITDRAERAVASALG